MSLLAGVDRAVFAAALTGGLRERGVRDDLSAAEPLSRAQHTWWEPWELVRERWVRTASPGPGTGTGHGSSR